jgi:type II secretory pathway pseudopilin PulG
MRLPNRGEGGYTLVEMLVVVTMLSAVLGVMFRGLVSLQDSAAGNEERLINLDEARLLMATITKDIRTAAQLTTGATPFEVADSREAVFYANVGNTSGPSKIHVYVDSENRLLESVIPPDAGSAPNYTYTGAATVRAVGRFVVPGSVIFEYQYFDDDTGTFVDLPAVPLSLEDRDKIESVEVTISIRKSNINGTPVTTLVNRVRLPNVYYNPASESQT